MHIHDQMGTDTPKTHATVLQLIYKYIFFFLCHVFLQIAVIAIKKIFKITAILQVHMFTHLAQLHMDKRINL